MTEANDTPFRAVPVTFWPPVVILILLLLSVGLPGPAVAAVTDLIPAAGDQTEQAGNGGGAGEDTNETSGADGGEEADEEPPPEPSAEPVQSTLEEEPEDPLESHLPTPAIADIREQIQALRNSLDNRQAAL
ncbi:MAG: hypothetical protein ACOCVV_11305, partial [Marinobacter sp.]